MLKHRVLVSGLLVCLTGLVSYGQAPRLKAEVELSTTSVWNKETFLVSTLLRNTGGEEQVLKIWSCSYSMQWTPDNPLVHENGNSCLRNTVARVRLAPGGSYKMKVPFEVTLPAGNAPSEAVTFRLGFSDALTPKIPLAWSNAVTVTVSR